MTRVEMYPRPDPAKPCHGRTHNLPDPWQHDWRCLYWSTRIGDCSGS